jgi:hypothetical protein
MSFQFFQRKEFVWFMTLLVLFIALHFYGLHIPYHQDEYKWVQYSHPDVMAPGTVPHPPLTEFIYADFLGPRVGDDNFRVIPFAFGLINLLLIFYLAKIVFDKKSALWTIFLFVISFFSLLASLMVDVDGAVMPMFFLIMGIGYYKLRVIKYELRSTNWKWLGAMVLGAVGGFLIKVSAILPIFALFLDFLIEKGVFSDKKRILKYLGFGILGLLGFVIILFASKFIFPFFNLEYSFKYWSHFANSSSFLNRGWLQTFIQFAKAIMYASPLLILPAFFSGREIFKKARPLFLFIFAGIIFYLFVFDFSIGALDRYFQFLVIPLCLISGAVFAKYFSDTSARLEKEDFITVPIILISVFVLQFFNNFVPPLYPKTEWINRILSLKWNFLFPFTGGSGPTGFYISFLFMAIIWICSIIFAMSLLKMKNVRKRALLCILALGILYNGVFIEEYLFGKINGSPYGLFQETKQFIAKNKDIKKVVVYNDIGGYEIREIGKYERRLYATPQFEEGYRNFFKNFSGHVLYIDIPKMGENNFYSNYLSSCTNIYTKSDKYITAKIFDCRK